MRLCLAIFIIIVRLLQVTSADNETLTFTTDWLNRSRYDHPDHDNHEFVALMSGELVDAMQRRTGLKGFDNMIVRSCGTGRRSMGHFTNFVSCLKDTKKSVMDMVENYTISAPQMSIRNHIAVTTFCGVLPRIVRCKEDLCSSISGCDNYNGFLELINQMHRLLIQYYCGNGSQDLVAALSGTSRECARHLLLTIQQCWGKAGLDYNDITSVLRRLSKKEMLCQQLIGSQLCLADQYQIKHECKGQLSEMIQMSSNSIKQELSCYKFGQEGRHLLGL